MWAPKGLHKLFDTIYEMYPEFKEESEDEDAGKKDDGKQDDDDEDDEDED